MAVHPHPQVHIPSTSSRKRQLNDEHEEELVAQGARIKRIKLEAMAECAEMEEEQDRYYFARRKLGMVDMFAGPMLTIRSAPQEDLELNKTIRQLRLYDFPASPSYSPTLTNRPPSFLHLRSEKRSLTTEEIKS